MKRYLLSFIAVLLLKVSAHSQSHFTYLRPLNIQAEHILTGTGMLKDTSGKLWFYASTSDNVTHIVNESRTIQHTFNATAIKRDGWDMYKGHIVMDSRNDIVWLSEYNNSVVNVLRNGALAQHTLPSMDSLLLDSSSYGYRILRVADDHNGNDYFLSEANGVAADSFFLTRFDGTTFTTFNLTLLGVNLHSNDYSYTRDMVCDYAGNVYIFDSTTLIKYDGVNLTSLELPQFIGGYAFCDYDNNLYKVVAGNQSNGNDAYKVLPNGTLQPMYSGYDAFLSVRNLFLGNDSSVWLFITGGGGALLKWDSDSFSHHPFFGFNIGDIDCSPYNYAWAEFDSHGNIFFTYYGGCRDIVPVYSFESSNVLNGQVFIDNNENGLRDNEETGARGINVIQLPDNVIGNTDSAGNYQAVFLFNQEHTLSPDVPMYYHNTTSVNIVVPDTATLCCYDFGIAPNGNIQDLEMSATVARAVPGFTNNHWISYKNVGTVNVSDTIE